MVHIDKVEGQKGSMILTEDGSIISSSGTLSNTELTASTIISLLTHNLQVDFTQPTNNNVEANDHHATGGPDSANVGGNVPTPVLKWNRLTVSYPTHSYIACLSNKKIHVVDRELGQPTNDDDIMITPDNNE